MNKLAQLMNIVTSSNWVNDSLTPLTARFHNAENQKIVDVTETRSGFNMKFTDKQTGKIIRQEENVIGIANAKMMMEFEDEE